MLWRKYFNMLIIFFSFFFDITAAFLTMRQGKMSGMIIHLILCHTTQRNEKHLIWCFFKKKNQNIFIRKII